jgi:2-desacetyl-2-hydroxyethyl bacteriochlorophyllide A dehydrogenase
MKINVRRIVFDADHRVRCETIEQQFTLGPDDVLLETEYSVASAGTELAKLSGLQKVDYPFVPGNRAVGRVIAVGDGVKDVKIGDRIFSHTVHASHTLAHRLRAPVPAEVVPQQAAFVGMALVAMTAVRVGQVELGDRAAVIGLGLVGNLSAQLLQLAGAEVIGIDLVEGRLATARTCGVQELINARQQETLEEVMKATNKRGVDVVVEASGVPESAELAASLTGYQGEGIVVLLGSPRKDYEANLTPLLNRVHLWRNGCVTFRGAHEWRYPLNQTPFTKHSMERNAQILFRLMAQGALKIDPLISHTFQPEEAAQAYDALAHSPQAYTGVLFDWTKSPGEEKLAAAAQERVQ